MVGHRDREPDGTLDPPYVDSHSSNKKPQQFGGAFC